MFFPTGQQSWRGITAAAVVALMFEADMGRPAAGSSLVP